MVNIGVEITWMLGWLAYLACLFIQPLQNSLHRLTLNFEYNMIATLGNNAINTLKPGAVLTVSDAQNEIDAQREVADFLQMSNRTDLSYFSISKNYFLLYSKSDSPVSGIA